MQAEQKRGSKSLCHTWNSCPHWHVTFLIWMNGIACGALFIVMICLDRRPLVDFEVVEAITHVELVDPFVEFVEQVLHL